MKAPGPSSPEPGGPEASLGGNFHRDATPSSGVGEEGRTAGVKTLVGTLNVGPDGDLRLNEHGRDGVQAGLEEGGHDPAPLSSGGSEWLLTDDQDETTPWVVVVRRRKPRLVNAEGCPEGTRPHGAASLICKPTHGKLGHTIGAGGGAHAHAPHPNGLGRFSVLSGEDSHVSPDPACTQDDDAPPRHEAHALSEGRGSGSLAYCHG